MIAGLLTRTRGDKSCVLADWRDHTRSRQVGGTCHAIHK